MNHAATSEICSRLHVLARRLVRQSFPFDRNAIPKNGIYLLFECGEIGHGGDRIVRVGTHTGPGQLPSRLGQHFLAENKDRSIFRKNIGRALLNRDGDPFLQSWNIDLTTRQARDRHLESVDLEYQSRIEAAVSRKVSQSLSEVEAAVAAIESDPQVREIVDMFDAEIDRSSVRPARSAD